MMEEKVYDYASFGQRLGALLIDGMIIGAGAGILIVIFGGVFLASAGGIDQLADPENMAPGTMIGAVVTYLLLLLVVVAGGWLYYALQESSPRMATIGKRAVGIVVTDMEGNRISFARASGRFFGKWVSGAIMYVGYIMAAFTEKKQALHDMMANCLVMKDK